MKQIFMLLIAMMIVTCGISQEKKVLQILVFSKTAGFRHESISSGVKMLFDQSKAQEWVLTSTENADLFTEQFLKNFDVVVFMNPTGNALDENQQIAFEKFMGPGKGFVGIHSSADFEYDWAWYGGLNGGFFKIHPPSQEATVKIENSDHPTMQAFKGMGSFTSFDEWYTFKTNPRDKVHVLASLDENSIKKFENDNWRMGDHPLVWWHEYHGAKAFYTGFGHTHEAFQNPVLVKHFTDAINWAGGRVSKP